MVHRALQQLGGRKAFAFQGLTSQSRSDSELVRTFHATVLNRGRLLPKFFANREKCRERSSPIFLNQPCYLYLQQSSYLEAPFR